MVVQRLCKPAPPPELLGAVIEACNAARARAESEAAAANKGTASQITERLASSISHRKGPAKAGGEPSISRELTLKRWQTAKFQVATQVSHCSCAPRLIQVPGAL